MRSLTMGARASRLAKVQWEEMAKELSLFGLNLELTPLWIETCGDKDKVSSLKGEIPPDFFTRELDAALLDGEIDLAVHSAKDLPDPLPSELEIFHMTQGIDPRDALLMREGSSLYTLPAGARIGTSSLRREDAVRSLRPDLFFVDIRGNIEERIALLEEGKVEGLVVAEAALIRLQLTHWNRVYLPGPTAKGQGRLALVGKKGADFALDLVFGNRSEPV